MAGSEQEKDKKPETEGESKPLAERLRDLVQGILDDLQSVFDPPRPVRVPVPAGPRRPR